MRLIVIIHIRKTTLALYRDPAKTTTSQEFVCQRDHRISELSLQCEMSSFMLKHAVLKLWKRDGLDLVKDFDFYNLSKDR